MVNRLSSVAHYFPKYIKHEKRTITVSMLDWVVFLVKIFFLKKLDSFLLVLLMSVLMFLAFSSPADASWAISASIATSKKECLYVVSWSAA